MTDPVNPAHYQRGEIECIDALRACMTPEEFRGYCRGSALAYLWRLGAKDAVEQEARKAAWYLAWLAGEDPRSQGKRNEQEQLAALKRAWTLMLWDEQGQDYMQSDLTNEEMDERTELGREIALSVLKEDKA